MSISRLDRPTPDALAALYAHPGDRGRCWVRLSFVTTLDGSVTDSNGTSGALGGESDRLVYTAMRHACDVVLVGAGTVRDEGYGPITTETVDADRRVAAGLAATPALAIVSGRLDLPATALGPGTVLVTTADKRPPPGIDVVAAGNDEIDWRGVLSAFAERGWTRVLCEGGPHLAGSLAEADVIDEVCLTISPELVGGDGPRLTAGALDVRRPMKLGHLVVSGDVLLSRWVRDRT